MLVSIKNPILCNFLFILLVKRVKWSMPFLHFSTQLRQSFHLTESGCCIETSENFVSSFRLEMFKINLTELFSFSSLRDNKCHGDIKDLDGCRKWKKCNKNKIIIFHHISTSIAPFYFSFNFSYYFHLKFVLKNFFII